MSSQRPVSEKIGKLVTVILISTAIALFFFGVTHAFPAPKDRSKGFTSLPGTISRMNPIPRIYALLERATLYKRFQERSARYREPLNKDIAIIGVDRKTLDRDRVMQILWPSRYYAPVMKMLLENGVKVIGLDDIQDVYIKIALEKILDDEFRKGVTESLKETLGPAAYRKSRLEDWTQSIVEEVPIAKKEKELQMLLYKYHRVVLPAILSPEHTLSEKPIDQMLFAAGEENLAIVNLPTGVEEVALRQELFYHRMVEHENKPIRSFGLRIVEKFLDKEAVLNDKDDRVTVDNETIPTDDRGRLLINYKRAINYSPSDIQTEKGETADFPRNYYSLIDVRDRADKGDREYFKRHFQGRIVLIGHVLPPQDTFWTPLGKRVLMPGVEVHAHIIRTLLDRDYIKRASTGVNLGALIILSVLAGLLTYRMKPLHSAIACLSLVALYILMTYVLFYYRSIWLDMSQVLNVMVVFGGVYSYRYITEDRERQMIRKVLERYVSKNVMETILSDPRNLNLGGTRKKVTILFSDLNDFTSHSEKLDPEDLMRFLNNYFNDMNAIILKYNGTIKQFVGDEIMVLFGAPMPQDDQAKRAVDTALEMIDWLKFMRKKDPRGDGGFYEVKIGIHTGEVVAGNVGSEDRTEYACVGDNVNLTSRIEGLNKKLGTTILISEDTYEEVKGKITDAEFTPFEPQEVKGKKNLIRVYEVKRSERGG